MFCNHIYIPPSLSPAPLTLVDRLPRVDVHRPAEPLPLPGPVGVTAGPEVLERDADEVRAGGLHLGACSDGGHKAEGGARGA